MKSSDSTLVLLRGRFGSTGRSYHHRAPGFRWVGINPAHLRCTFEPMNLDVMDNLRQLARLVPWVVNLVAWWLAITSVLWDRARPRHDFLPNGLPLAAFVIALCINTLLGFAVRGLSSKR